MRILLSNDDGVHAPGLLTMYQALRLIAEVQVIAPDRDRSGASNSLSLNRPLHRQQLENGFISVSGTPTDCVHLGITGLLEQQPDMVVAGVNRGPNLGDDTLYSGTVAAATEGRFLGLPAIAVSLVGSQHFTTAANIAKQLVLRLKVQPLPAQTILNVNVPDVPLNQISGFEVTRLGSRHQAEATIEDRDPAGNTIYWIGPPGAKQDAGPGTDFNAVKLNKVSITPLKIDLTNYQSFDQVASWVEGMHVE
ncbi:MAG: 5'/3'-nucleotidase SurE [Gammaproteobacteria bacterium]